MELERKNAELEDAKVLSRRGKLEAEVKGTSVDEGGEGGGEGEEEDGEGLSAQKSIIIARDRVNAESTTLKEKAFDLSFRSICRKSSSCSLSWTLCAVEDAR